MLISLLSDIGFNISEAVVCDVTFDDFVRMSSCDIEYSNQLQQKLKVLYTILYHISKMPYR